MSVAPSWPPSGGEPAATLADDVEAFVAGAKVLVERAKAIGELRAKRGRRIGVESRERLGELSRGLRELRRTLEPLIEHEPEADAEAREAARIELERFRQYNRPRC